MLKEDLLTIVDNSLREKGYKKKGLSWYKENPETFTVFSLDRSRWGGEMYYVYLSVNFKGLDLEKNPKFYKCHSSLRGEHLDESLKEYLDLETDIKEAERTQKIKKLLDKSVQILNKMESISGFKELLQEYNPRLFMVNTKAQAYLGINID